MNIRNTSCCALWEIEELRSYQGDSEQAIIHLCRLAGEKAGSTDPQPVVPHCAFILFSGNATGSYDTALKQYIEDHQLGSVTVSPVKENPNTSNNVTIYVWAMDRPALSRWLTKRSKVTASASQPIAGHFNVPLDAAVSNTVRMGFWDWIHGTR